MAHEMQATHINAYLVELQEAEDAAVKAQSRVNTLKRQIDDKLVEDGQERLYFEEDGSPKKNRKRQREQAPVGANGFGLPTNGGGNV